ncbi:hypothetical protein CYR55_05300 [Chimaeribacter californicus]|uniref:Protein TonB n=1 Tax=Chimaeribacter californicus TaxID=2060067 RepID=A0A2N5EDW9_9GAMM|nr:TonB family protein [Chimaeribacter californicus]PLR40697.1 hypothetical protein CYR55_05300 [Chimaeribacter californicus]
MKPYLVAIAAMLPLLTYAKDNSLSYPRRAEALRIDGHVKVIYDVNNKGVVENIRFIEASPKHSFEKSIREQMRHWHFKANDAKRDVPLDVTFKAN